MVDRGSVAPAFLDPILALVERIDRSLRRVRPIRPGAILCVEPPRRHRGATVVLADGTTIRPGDRVVALHLDNRRVAELTADGTLATGFAVGREDLRHLAAWHRRLPAGERPVAYGGAAGVIGPLFRRVGVEVRPRRRTPWVRLEDWYLRSLLARWARGGRRRLTVGRAPLVTWELWLSAAELERRHGAASGGFAGPARDPETRSAAQ